LGFISHQHHFILQLMFLMAHQTVAIANSEKSLSNLCNAVSFSLRIKSLPVFLPATHFRHPEYSAS
jgi:hypothetical protein